MTALNPNGNPIRVGQLTLRTPGLVGDATAVPIQPGGGTRGRQLTTAALDEALASSNVQPQYLIEISQTREVPAPTGPTRSTNYGEPALIVDVPATGPEWGQVLLYIDESGVVTWNFPRATDNSLDTSRGQGTKTFVIPRYVAPPPSGGTRGLAGSLGSKVLKVVSFRCLSRRLAQWATTLSPGGNRETGHIESAHSLRRTTNPEMSSHLTAAPGQSFQANGERCSWCTAREARLIRALANYPPTTSAS